MPQRQHPMRHRAGGQRARWSSSSPPRLATARLSGVGERTELACYRVSAADCAEGSGARGFADQKGIR